MENLATKLGCGSTSQKDIPNYWERLFFLYDPYKKSCPTAKATPAVHHRLMRTFLCQKLLSQRWSLVCDLDIVYALHFSLGFILHIWSDLELLPSDVVCAKETRDLVIECCVGEQYSSSRTLYSWSDDMLWFSRVHSLDIIRGKRDMRAGIEENNSPWTYHWGSQGVLCFCTYLRLLMYIAPQRLGFDSFTAEVEDVLKDHKQQQKVPVV